MSQRVIVHLVDDLEAARGNEAPATQQIRFGYEGRILDIDLTDDNAAQFHAAMEPFAKAARQAPSGTIPHRTDLKRGARRATTAASKHKPQDDTTAIREWAVRNQLIEPGKRGRIRSAVKDAYQASQNGDDGPLKELQADDTPDTPGTLRSAAEPALKAANAVAARERRPMTPPAPEPAPEAPAAADESYDETKAREHYAPLAAADRHPNQTDENKWARRTGYGSERTERIADFTLTERLASLTPRHAEILKQLAGLVEIKNGRVAHLKTSEARLHKLELIRYAPNSQHGWEITDFGRYAVQMYSMGE